MRAKALLPFVVMLMMLVAVPSALGQSSGGTSYEGPGGAPAEPSQAPPAEQPPGTTRSRRARIVNGLAVAPAGAPRAEKRAIAAANRIVGKPYR